MIKNVSKLIMLFLSIAFLLVNCSNYDLDKYDANIRYKGKRNTLERTSIRNGIARHAKKYLGVKYSYAGTSPKGFDCSGFTSYVLKKFDISLPRSSAAQAQSGRRVVLEKVRPGDLVFFSGNKKGKISHVALVFDNSKEGIKVIHSTTSRGVIIENISKSKYWRPKIKYAVNVID
ncbi:MAG TPA: NlpC/P60 family protein [Bacteroidetes bacterium]|nr:NlpC/P60 family protein [Bacteroidota bacterium]